MLFLVLSAMSVRVCFTAFFAAPRLEAYAGRAVQPAGPAGPLESPVPGLKSQLSYFLPV